MVPEASDMSGADLGIGLPQPRPGARWRWAAPRGALVGGGVLAAVLAVGPVAGAATNTRPDSSSGTIPGTGGAPPSAPARATGVAGRPTVSGRITALQGDDIRLEIRTGPGPSGTGTSATTTTATVVYSDTTTFNAVSVRSHTTAASSPSALKVGAFVAVDGTKHGDIIDASSVVIGGGPPAAPARSRPTPRSP